MHIVICLIYGLTCWFSLMAYAAITGLNLGLAVIGGPVVVSGSIVALIALDWLPAKVVRLCKQWF